MNSIHRISRGFAAAAAVALAVMFAIADDARAQDLTGIEVTAVPIGEQFETILPLMPLFSTGITEYNVFLSRGITQFGVTAVGAIRDQTSIGGQIAGSNTFTVSTLPHSVTIVHPVAGSPKTYTVTIGTGPVAPVLETPTVLSRSLALNWAAPSDIGSAPVTGYKVRWAAESAPATYLNAGGAGGIDAPGGANATFYAIAGLADGTAYQVQVAAVNSFGYGDWSAAQSATPATAPIIKQVICITQRDAVVASFAQCQTIAASGFSIPKSAGEQLLKVTAYLFQPLAADAFLASFGMRQRDDPRNPLVADVDIDGAQPDFEQTLQILTPRASVKEYRFAITPKPAGDGGRIDIFLVPTGSGSNDDAAFQGLAPNELQGTFLQVVDADINFTEAAAGACPDPNGGAASALSLAEGGEAGVLCVSLAADPGAGAVSVGCVAEQNALGMDAVEVTPGALSFASGNWQAGQAVSMLAIDNDNAAGASSAVALRCTATAPGAANSAYANLSKEFELTLTDADMVAATGTFTAGNISENGGAQMVQITATLGSDIASQTDCAVTVEIGSSAIAGSGGTALAVVGDDYAAFSPPAITIAAGELSGSVMVAVTPEVDSDRDSEGIPLTAMAMACGGAAVDFGAAEIIIFDTGIRISDANEDGSCPAMPASNSSGISLEEGGAEDASEMVCVSLLLAPDFDVEVTCGGSASAGLFTAAPAALTFTASDNPAGQLITLQAVDNNLSAPAADATDPFTCTATADAASGYSGISQAVTVTITDDTDADIVSSAGATLSATSVRKDNAQFTQITATLAGDIAPLEDCTVTLAIETAAITDTRGEEIAVAGEDYSAFTLFSLTIPAGKTSGSADYTIDTTSATDTDRQTESIPISGESASCGGVTDLVFAAAEILIFDVRLVYSRADADGNCPAAPTVADEVTRITLVEGESAVMCLRLPADPALDGITAMSRLGTVDCSLLDFATLSPDPLPAFTVGDAGTWKAGHAATITALQDNISGGDRGSFFSCSAHNLNLDNLAGNARYGAHRLIAGTLNVFVTEDDIVATTGVLTAGSIGENGGAQMVRITATLDGASRPAADCAVTVTIGSSEISDTRGGALAAAPGDYTAALTPPTITIPARELSGSGLLAITPVVDADDAVESIPLSASAACGGVGVFAGPSHGSESVAFGMAEILILDFNLALLDGAAGMTYADGILVARYLAGARGADLTAGLGLADEASVAA
ncbi:MAG: fibronectin type III domain-containing protein, partial [Gammaproteobacteria bacterium]